MLLGHPFYVARSIAVQTRNRLRPYCHRIVVAGSVRRQRPQIGDIELIAIPIIESEPSLFPGMGLGESKNLLLDYLDNLVETNPNVKKSVVNGRTTWGERQRKFDITTKNGRVFKIDLFLCTPETWGNTLLIRTGPEQFSTFMVTAASEGGGLPEGMYHRGNKLRKQGKHIPLYEERDYFRVTGIPYIPPKLRGGWVWNKDE